MTERKFETRGDATPSQPVIKVDDITEVLNHSPDYTEKSEDMKKMWDNYHPVDKKNVGK